MPLLTGKRGLVFGVANDRSYAWHIARELLGAGAKCLFTHLPGARMEHRVRLALADLGLSHPWLAPCDVGRDEDLDAVFGRLREDFGRLDFVIHSVAYADREYLVPGKFHQTPRAVWTQALDISAYSLVAMARRAVPLMPRGGALVAMSYYGGEKVVPGYNVMGIAKAALEHATRYLASELGPKGIRVNSISGGPLRTLAASAVGGISDMFDHHRRRAPLRRNIEGEEVARAAVFLVSDAAGGITGENLHVDAGYHAMGL